MSTEKNWGELSHQTRCMVFFATKYRIDGRYLRRTAESCSKGYCRSHSCSNKLSLKLPFLWVFFTIPSHGRFMATGFPREICSGSCSANYRPSSGLRLYGYERSLANAAMSFRGEDSFGNHNFHRAPSPNGFDLYFGQVIRNGVYQERSHRPMRTYRSHKKSRGFGGKPEVLDSPGLRDVDNVEPMPTSAACLALTRTWNIEHASYNRIKMPTTSAQTTFKFKIPIFSNGHKCPIIHSPAQCGSYFLKF